MWQELEHYIGRRTTGTKAARYVRAHARPKRGPWWLEGPRRGNRSMRHQGAARYTTSRRSDARELQRRLAETDDCSGHDTAVFPVDLDDEGETPSGAAEAEMWAEELPNDSALLVVKRGRSAGARFC